MAHRSSLPTFHIVGGVYGIIMGNEPSRIPRARSVSPAPGANTTAIDALQSQQRVDPRAKVDVELAAGVPAGRGGEAIARGSPTAGQNGAANDQHDVQQAQQQQDDAGPRPATDQDSAEGLWALPEGERARVLTDFYDVPDAEMGRGHYGVVRKAVRKADGGRVAVKSIAKRRAVYVDMLRNEINILRKLAGEPGRAHPCTPKLIAAIALWARPPHLWRPDPPFTLSSP